MPKIARKYATTSEAEIRGLTAQGMTFVQIAAKLNVPIGSLRTTACVLGIKSGRGHDSASLPLHAWIDHLAAGGTLDEIATDRKLTPQAIQQHLSRRGLPSSCRAAVKFKALQASKQQQAA